MSTAKIVRKSMVHSAGYRRGNPGIQEVAHRVAGGLAAAGGNTLGWDEAHGRSRGGREPLASRYAVRREQYSKNIFLFRS